MGGGGSFGGGGGGGGSCGCGALDEVVDLLLAGQRRVQDGVVVGVELDGIGLAVAVLGLFQLIRPFVAE